MNVSRRGHTKSRPPGTQQDCQICRIHDVIGIEVAAARRRDHSPRAHQEREIRSVDRAAFVDVSQSPLWHVECRAEEGAKSRLIPSQGRDRMHSRRILEKMKGRERGRSRRGVFCQQSTLNDIDGRIDRAVMNIQSRNLIDEVPATVPQQVDACLRQGERSIYEVAHDEPPRHGEVALASIDERLRFGLRGWLKDIGCPIEIDPCPDAVVAREDTEQQPTAVTHPPAKDMVFVCGRNVFEHAADETDHIVHFKIQHRAIARRHESSQLPSDKRFASVTRCEQNRLASRAGICRCPSHVVVTTENSHRYTIVATMQTEHHWIGRLWIEPQRVPNRREVHSAWLDVVPHHLKCSTRAVASRGDHGPIRCRWKPCSPLGSDSLDLGGGGWQEYRGQVDLRERAVGRSCHDDRDERGTHVGSCSEGACWGPSNCLN